MLYRIQRNGQTYGPYTKEDLQRYLASGNVLLTDLAKSDDMPEWVPVSQILADGPASVPPHTAPTAQYAPVSQPYVASSSAPAVASGYPDPPDLGWGLLLLFGILTCGIFTLVYEFLQASYVKKIVPASKAMFYLIALVVLQFLNAGGSTARIIMLSQGIYTPHLHRTPDLFGSAISGLVGMAVLVMLILYRFTMRGDLLAHFNGPEPIGLQLGPIMTFFFGGLYFEYHFNKINAIKRAHGMACHGLTERRSMAALTVLAGLAGGWVLLRFPPSDYAFYPVCPIHAVFGVQCPGCGATRALAALLRGHLAEAWRLNALAVALLPFCLAFAAECLRRAFRDARFDWPKVPDAATYAALAIGAVFTVTRNLS